MLNVLENPLMVNEMNDFSPIRELVSDKPLGLPLENLKNALIETAEIHEARISFIKNEIQKGTYQISSKQIAQLMLDYSV